MAEASVVYMAYLAGLGCVMRGTSYQDKLLLGTLAPLTAGALHALPTIFFAIRGSLESENFGILVRERFWNSLVALSTVLYTV
eukprot:2521525-Rhodomonas_salina.7